MSDADSVVPGNLPEAFAAAAESFQRFREALHAEVATVKQFQHACFSRGYCVACRHRLSWRELFAHRRKCGCPDRPLLLGPLRNDRCGSCWKVHLRWHRRETRQALPAVFGKRPWRKEP